MAVSKNLILAMAPRPKGTREKIKSGGNTRDIISAVKLEHAKTWRESISFCHLLKGRTRKETFQNIWTFLKRNTTYKEDPIPFQFTLSPSVLLHSARSDCKGFSLFSASVLRCLGIPHKFRFIIPPGKSNYKHVYVVGILENGEEYPIDPIPQISAPGKETSYIKRLDIMAEIYSLNGIQKSEVLEGELEFELQLERLILERGIVRRSGGSTAAYDRDILEMKRAAKGLDQYGPEYLSGMAEIAGLGKFLRKVGQKIKDGVSAAVKVLTAPQKAFFNVLSRVTLPKAAPFFIYNFEKNPSSLPAKARVKYNKSLKLASWIMKVTGMKEETFMRIIRNGIMKHMGNTPEVILSRAKSGASMAGIGAIPTAAIPIISKIIESIVNLFKVHKEAKITEQDAPDLQGDFQILSNTHTQKPSPHNTTQQGNNSPQNYPPSPKQSKGSMAPILIGAAVLAIAMGGNSKKRSRR